MKRILLISLLFALPARAMIIMDTAGDTLQAEASAASSLTVHVYGVETASSVETFKNLGVGELASGSQTTLYTVPASTKTLITTIIVCNTNASARTLDMWDVANGGSVGNANAVFEDITINGKSTMVWYRGEISMTQLTSDDDIPEAGDYVNLTGGKGIDNSPTGTVLLDLTEWTGNVSWNDGATDASFTWTYNLSAGTDPVWTIGDNSMDLSTGALKEGGVAVHNNDEMDGSAELLAIIDDETGSGGGTPLIVFNYNPTLTGALLAGILSDNDDMVFEIDADNDGSNKYSWTDGASAEIASLTEAGVFTAGSVTDGTATLTGGALTGLTTALTVAQGGTGATSLNDGYVLLGSVTGAITPLNCTADGAIMIGDGTTDPVALDVGSSTAITILGTVATGVWQATAIADGYVPDTITIDLAAEATILATPRTIAGVSFNGSANIAIASTGLSDTADLLYEAELDDLSELTTQIGDVSTFITDDIMPDAGTDPDVDAAGELSVDTDGANETDDVTLRTWDGTRQVALASASKQITISIVGPDSINVWTGRVNPSQPVWFNDSGMSYVIEKVYAISDDDNYDFTLFESASATDMSDDNDASIIAMECDADGTECYTDEETGIAHTVEHDHAIIFEDTLGSSDGLIIVIKGYLLSDVD